MLVPNNPNITKHKSRNQQTDKPNAQHNSPTQQTDKPNAGQKSRNQQTDKPNAQHKSPTQQTDKNKCLTEVTQLTNRQTQC